MERYACPGLRSLFCSLSRGRTRGTDQEAPFSFPGLVWDLAPYAHDGPCRLLSPVFNSGFVWTSGCCGVSYFGDIAFWPLCMAAAGLLGPVLFLAFWLWLMRWTPSARHMARHAVDMQLRTSQGLAATARRPCRRVAGLLTPANGPRGGFFAVRTGYEPVTNRARTG